MKKMKRIVSVFVVLLIIVMMSSCNNQVCPAYTKVVKHENQKQA